MSRPPSCRSSIVRSRSAPVARGTRSSMLLDAEVVAVDHDPVGAGSVEIVHVDHGHALVPVARTPPGGNTVRRQHHRPSRIAPRLTDGQAPGKVAGADPGPAVCTDRERSHAAGCRDMTWPRINAATIVHTARTAATLTAPTANRRARESPAD